MDQFINFLLLFSALNEQQIALLQSKCHIHDLQTAEYFSQAGQTPQRIGFVLEGIFRVCYYDKEENEHTRYFVEENNFIVDLNSYQQKLPSTEYIQAILPSKILVLNRSSLAELSTTILDWDKIMAQISARALMEKVHRISPMLAEDAKTRYVEFFHRFPKLANRIPLHYLASYIGITKHSLSRIRKEISENQ